MSEENVAETQEVNDDLEVNENPEEQGPSIDNLEDAVKLIGKLRKEAASRRIKGKEAEEKAAKWEEYVESQKTEMEKLIDRATKLEQALEVEKVEKLRAKIVTETGLDPDLADLLKGSEKEMRALAAKLVEKTGTAGKVPDFYAGQRGNKVAPKAETLNDWFTNLWKETEENSSRKKFSSS